MFYKNEQELKAEIERLQGCYYSDYDEWRYWLDNQIKMKIIIPENGGYRFNNDFVLGE
jgi:hypothetical protein